MSVMNNQNDGYYTKILLNKLIEKNRAAKNKIEISEVEKAIYFAKKYHGKQTRHSGEPYYSHPIEVANIVSDYIFDTDTIISAILHDVLEDTQSSLTQIELVFNKQIAEIVDTLTKFTIEHQLSQEEIVQKIINFPDVKKKAITIKVIDRLHNMRTIFNIKSIEKQKKIAQETLDFYLSMAKIAKLPEIETELRNLSNNVLNK